MTTVVNFELAKLLKEKGFEETSQKWYSTEGSHYYQDEFSNNRGSVPSYCCEAPTIAEIVMWLYEKHGIWISVDWMSRTKPYNSGFYCHLRGTNKYLNQDNFIVINDTLEPGYEVFNLPTKAYEAAIEYTLKELI